MTEKGEIMVFEPTENMKLIKYELNNIKLLGKKVHCIYPNRIHITPIDCNRFNYGEPGGGGIGFAIKSENSISIELSSVMKYSGPKDIQPIVTRSLYLVSTLLELEQEFSIKINLSPEVLPHIGLGSNACLMTAICASINTLYNSPLSNRNLMEIIGSNFAECYHGKCVLGLDTGVGPATTLLGGFCLVSMDSLVVWQHKFDFIPKVFIVNQAVKRPHFEGSEDDIMLKRSLYEDIKSRGIKSYEILMDLLPAISRHNLKRMGDIIWNIQFSGTHLSMIQRYDNSGENIYSLLCKSKANNIEIIGLSSVGPSVFICSSKPAQVVHFLQSEDLPFLETEVQSNPLKPEIET